MSIFQSDDPYCKMCGIQFKPLIEGVKYCRHCRDKLSN